VLAAPLLKKIAAEASDHTIRIEELKQTLTGGDPDRGRQLFFGKAVCVQCHRIGRQGSGVGPDLSQIGSIRTRRDLLEAIVAPSATLARGYESVTVVASGRPISGIVRNETATAVHVLTADRSETIIPREEIDEIVPNCLSIMPQGLDRNLTEGELQDLLAFLSSLGSSASADRKK
jgi:putative heme-binding domain-containing protein